MRVTHRQRVQSVRGSKEIEREDLGSSQNCWGCDTCPPHAIVQDSNKKIEIKISMPSKILIEVTLVDSFSYSSAWKGRSS